MSWLPTRDLVCVWLGPPLPLTAPPSQCQNLHTLLWVPAKAALSQHHSGSSQAPVTVAPTHYRASSWPALSGSGSVFPHVRISTRLCSDRSSAFTAASDPHSWKKDRNPSQRRQPTPVLWAIEATTWQLHSTWLTSPMCPPPPPSQTPPGCTSDSTMVAESVWNATSLQSSWFSPDPRSNHWGLSGGSPKPSLLPYFPGISDHARMTTTHASERLWR